MQVVQKSEEEEHNPLKNWREKMAGQPLPEDPAKKSRDLKVPEVKSCKIFARVRGGNVGSQGL